MPTPVIQPALVFNFSVSLWDSPAYGLGNDAVGALGTAVSAGLDILGSFLFGGFATCRGLDIDLELEEYHAGGSNTAKRVFRKLGSHPPLTFGKGITTNGGMWDWAQQVVAGEEPPKRKDGIVMLLERGGLNPMGAGIPIVDRLPVAVWLFRRALPKGIKGPELDAKSNAVAIETLEIAHEGLQRLSLASVPGLGDVAQALGALPSALSVGLGTIPVVQSARVQETQP